MTGSRFARRELERRFLLDALPPGRPAAVTAVSDRYIHGTRLRLRRMTGDGASVYKLTQKADGYLTTIYLDTAEHAVFAALPADTLEKTRLSFPPLVVDVIAPDLLVAEVEFGDEEAMAAYHPPPFVGREITGDAALTGAALAARARASRPHEG